MSSSSLYIKTSNKKIFFIFFTWFLTALFFTFQFFLRSSPNGLKTQLLSEFSLNPATFGFFASVYYWPYAFLQIPVGFLLDTFGPKKILRFGSIVCVLGVFAFAFSPTFPLALLSRFLIGLGASVGFISGVRLNTLWVPKKYLALSIGALAAMGKIFGGAFSAGFLKTMIQWTQNWRTIFYTLGIFGVFLVLAIWIFVKNGPEDNFQEEKLKNTMEDKNSSKINKSLFSVLLQPSIFLLGLYGYSLYTMLSVFGDVHSSEFLSLRFQHMGLPFGQEKQWLASLIFIGSAIGAPTFSYLSDLFKKRKFFLVLCSFMVLLLSSLLFYGPLFGALVGPLIFFTGFFVGGHILIFAAATDVVPRKSLGIALGAINGSMILSGAFHNALMGFLLKFFSQHTTGVINLQVYQYSFLGLSIMFFMALIGVFFLKESHPHKNPLPKNIEILQNPGL